METPSLSQYATEEGGLEATETFGYSNIFLTSEKYLGFTLWVVVNFHTPHSMLDPKLCQLYFSHSLSPPRFYIATCTC